MLHQLSLAKGLVLSLKIQKYFIVAPCLQVHVYVSVWMCVCVCKERLSWGIATHSDSTQFSIFLSHFLQPVGEHSSLHDILIMVVQGSLRWSKLHWVSERSFLWTVFQQLFQSSLFQLIFQVPFLNPTAFGNKDCAFLLRQRWAISEDPNTIK